MKKTIVKLLLILAALFISIGSTIAYLTDTDGDINVMTLGRVEIDLIEQERRADGSLTDYQDNHPILPGVYQNDPPTDANGYWQDVHNAVDKIVSVKNTGNTSAYVRIWFAFEVTADDNFFDEKLHLNKNESDNWYWEFLRDADGSYTFLEQNGARYVMAVATYTRELPSNESTSVSLRQVLLDSSATNEDLIDLGEKYSIFVVAQAIQAQGFNSTTMARTYANTELNNAMTALNEGFGIPSADTVPFEGMGEGNTESPDVDSNVLVINTADELFALAQATNNYAFANRTIVLGADIDLENQAFPGIHIWNQGFCGVFDGQGHTISNLSISGWGLFPIVAPEARLTIRNLYIDGVSNESKYKTEAYTAVLVGLADGKVDIENCHVSNATINCIWSGDQLSSDAGIFIGFLNEGTITNCSVKNCTVYSEDKVGSIVGAACYAQITNIIEENVNLFIRKDETVTEYQPSGCNTRYGTIHGKMVRNEWSWNCTDCGEIEYHNCIFICGELEPCVCCGAIYSPDDYYPIHQWQYSDVTNQTHTIECASCGKILITEEGGETEDHHAYCLEADDGICAGCGASGVTIGKQWHYEGYKNITATTHDYGCLVCDYVESTNDHYYHSTHCKRCGAKKVTHYAKVVQDGVSFSKTPSGSVIATLDINTMWPIISTQDSSGATWYYIDINSICGYVHGDYIIPIPASDFKWEETADGKGVSIIQYVGSDTEVVIPSTINKLPVTGIQYPREYYDHNGLSIAGGAFYGTNVAKVIIPNSVNVIGEYAFFNCQNLTSITIPDTVISIDYGAFSGCSNLMNITIPDSVNSIDFHAFEGCTSLTSITIPDSVTSIGCHAFADCTSLTSITIPNGVSSINNRTFSGCTNLASVTIPDNITSIDGCAFSECTSLMNITIPDSVTKIGVHAFSGCTNLTSINIPDSVTSIDDYSFAGCTSLTSITIPDGVTSIGLGAFRECISLTKITLPDSVADISWNAFEGCSNITIYAHAGSKAANWCIKFDVPFQAIQ